MKSTKLIRHIRLPGMHTACGRHTFAVELDHPVVWFRSHSRIDSLRGYICGGCLRVCKEVRLLLGGAL